MSPSTKSVLDEFAEQPLKVLDPSQVKQIDEALCRLGETGELRLIKNKGRLRFITLVGHEEAIDIDGNLGSDISGQSSARLIRFESTR